MKIDGCAVVRAVAKSIGHSFDSFDLSLLKIPGAISSQGDPDGGAIASGETLAPAGELSISDLDAFQFNGNAGDRVLISAEPTLGSTAVYISLYPPDSGPREIIRHQEVDHQLQQTGLYTMVIEEWGRDAESTYDLSLLKIPGAISSPGDPDGGAIASGETLAPAGELSISDLDAFHFYGDAGDRVLIGAEPTSGSTAVYISLYPPDSGPREIIRHQEVDHQLQQTGLYTMVIEEWGRDAESTYDLSIAKIPSQLRPGLYNPNPSDGALVCNLNNSFSWNVIHGATGYDLYFGENVTVPLKKIGNNLRSPSMAFPAMKVNKIYYWQVIAHTSAGEIEGPYWWFQTQACGAKKAEIIGTWDSGIWYYDFAARKWTKMTSSVPSGDIAAGDFTGDKKADVASNWSNGLWYQNGANLGWKKVTSTASNRLTAGDVTGDSRAEIIGTWGSGIWYWNVAASSWTQMTSFSTSGDIAAGDFTGDKKADVASNWSSGLWYQNGATLGWKKVTSEASYELTAGNIAGK